MKIAGEDALRQNIVETKRYIEEHSGVQSFNGRSGSVLPMAGDYSAEQVNYDSNTTVKQKIDALVTKEASDIAGQQSLVKDTVGWTGKNLLKNTATTRTINGVTLTVNADKSVTVDGTATASVFLDIPISLPIGEYVFSGTNNQSDGSPSKYYARMRKSGGIQFATSEISPLPVQSVNGSEIKFKVLQDNLDIRYQICIYPAAGAVSNLTFYPMIRKADITDPTYEPYHESVEVMYEEEIHGVNLLEVTASTQTINGVTFTVNANKSITVNGTLSQSDAGFNIFCLADLPDGEFILSGIEGGSSTTYELALWTRPESGSGWVSVRIGSPSGRQARLYDNSNPIVFDKNKLYRNSDSTLIDPSNIFVNVIVRTNVSNITFYPMIRKADIEDSTYRPYNNQAIQNQLNAQGVLGAKNLLKNDAKSQTVNGVTFTVNADGSVVLNGTATNTGTFILVPNSSDAEFSKHNCILTGCPVGGSNSTYNLCCAIRTLSDSGVAWFNDFGSGVKTRPITSSEMARVYITYYSGQTYTNLTFKPMLRLASDPDDTYQPYAMTNRELTEKSLLKPFNNIISNVDLDNIISSGCYVLGGNITHGAGNYGILIVFTTSTANTQVRQIFMNVTEDAFFTRHKNDGTWSSWYKFTGTVVS